MGNADSKGGAASLVDSALDGLAGLESPSAVLGSGNNSNNHSRKFSSTYDPTGGGGENFEEKKEMETTANSSGNMTNPTSNLQSKNHHHKSSAKSVTSNSTRSSPRRTPRKKGSRNKSSSSRHRDHDGTTETGQVTSMIAEDQVHVNLAMADLMAYLQVVANNSNHLPLTRRDDPELDRTVSTLTPEDYARKSAAFIPADVRVIGGVFTRYGRVWDLPTSMEYTACDGALEPGRSYGGACANTLLKVLYDAANEATDKAQTDAAAATLFEDDDDENDEDDDGLSFTQKSCKSNYSIDCSVPNPTTLSWVDLLRKMKAEMKDIEYAQVPKITCTRKLDLTKPFALVPEDFDSTKNKKRALLIGCNYGNVPGAELKASHDDVRSMKDYIVNVHGFPEKGLMTVLLDDDEHDHPTFMNITEAFKALSEESHPGDAVFIQFSGHGGRILDSATDEEAESYDEVIVPSDYQVSGLIRDTLIFKTLLASMRYGVTVTVVIDCCDNGMLLELPYSWSTKGDKQRESPKMTINDDFSFVRFLKVVKTLYESSTFTQLGKTVGSALNADMDHDMLPDTDGESDAEKDKLIDPLLSSGDNASKSIFEMIAKACVIDPKEAGGRSSRKKRDKSQRGQKESILDKMINTCSVFTPEDDDEATDEDTFRTNTDDGYSYDETTDNNHGSFDSFTDEESVERRTARGRSRRK